ncbi:TPA: hypothetical protein HNC25_17015 [Escherichia coli]|nr:hypothetical protein [Escherichia coli]EFN8702852.1 hypothetical protein [Escherichia coli O79]MHP07393.1 hypothetical protein [Escherichia coli]HAJ6420145.1 hypothetical protein [Escherichia coli]HAJ6449029.1 hypothetical protein [Escherichia coli]
MISLMIVSENTRVWWHQAELTGRHPAPCNERYIALLSSPSPEGLFNEGKTLGSEMLNHSQFR